MFAWNPIKAQANIIKHGVSFLTACGVFLDSNALEIVTPDKYGEKRFKSARQASKKERKAYAES